MSGIPLHPLVVHFPIVLVVLLPISVVVALWAVRKGATVRRAWAVPLAFAAALTLSAWVALQTGEAQEDRMTRDRLDHVLATEIPVDVRDALDWEAERFDWRLRPRYSASRSAFSRGSSTR